MIELNKPIYKIKDLSRFFNDDKFFYCEECKCYIPKRQIKDYCSGVTNFKVRGVERMRIFAGGNFGIGMPKYIYSHHTTRRSVSVIHKKIREVKIFN